MKTIQTSYLQTPAGTLLLGSFGDKLCLCEWKVSPHGDTVARRIEHFYGATFQADTSPVIEETKRQLEEYFSLQRHTFSLPLALVGTDFQKAVWHSLMQIPYGQTVSYAAVASELGSKAVRAAATACATNALAVIVPCHRVVGSNGKLTSYAGGLEAKKYLLYMERHEREATLPLV